MITVLTITKRNGWFEDALKTLEAQTIKEIKWVIVYEPEVIPTIAPKSHITIKWVPAPKKKYRCNLNAAVNEGLRHVDGEVVVFYDDFIKLEPDTIEKLIIDVQENNAFITTATINPDGKNDARYTGMDGLREIEPKEWEQNMGAAPMQALYDLGGADEEYDKGWAWGNVNIAERAELLGYSFYIDESIKPQLLHHIKEPDLDKTLELNYMRHEMTMRQIQIGDKPIKLSYL